MSTGDREVPMTSAIFRNRLRIPIPDVVVTTSIDYNKPVVDADAVRLVCEIVSPSDASADRATSCA